MKNFRAIFIVLSMLCVFSSPAMEGREVTQEQREQELKYFLQWASEPNMLIEPTFFTKLQEWYSILEKENNPKLTKIFLQKTLHGLKNKEENQNSVYYPDRFFYPANLKDRIYSWIEKKLNPGQMVGDHYNKRIGRKRKAADSDSIVSHYREKMRRKR